MIFIRPKEVRKISPDCCRTCQFPKFLSGRGDGLTGWFCSMHQFRFANQNIFSSYICDGFIRKDAGISTEADDMEITLDDTSILIKGREDGDVDVYLRKRRLARFVGRDAMKNALIFSSALKERMSKEKDGTAE